MRTNGATSSRKDDDDAASVLIFGWKRKYIILAVLAICLELIVVIVFAIMLAMKNSEENNNNNNNSNEMPTIPQTTTSSPTIAPTTTTTNMTACSEGNNNTIPCVQDGACGFIFDGLGPVVPPAANKSNFAIPSTCQQKAREWLNATTTMTPLDDWRIVQRYALVVFYCEMNGDNWTRNDNWLSEEAHECEWYNDNEDTGEAAASASSSACDMEGQLTSLRLPNNALSGTLPAELGRLSFLIDMDLSNNPRIFGTIPREYDTIVNLKSLQLSSTFYDSSPFLPPYLFRMFPRLQRLELANNEFTGILPTDLPEYMPQLMHLDLANNLLSFEIPSNFGELNLHQLHLQANRLSGTIPPELFQPPNLEGLYLHDNILSGTIPIDDTTVDNFVNQKNLTEATFYGNFLLEGSIAEDICDRISFELDAWVNLHVDCDRISCVCCLCTPLEV